MGKYFLLYRIWGRKDQQGPLIQKTNVISLADMYATNQFKGLHGTVRGTTWSAVFSEEICLAPPTAERSPGFKRMKKIS